MKINHSNRQYSLWEYITPADVFLPQTERNQMEGCVGGRAFLKISIIVALKIVFSIRTLGHTKKGPKTGVIHITYTF